LDCKFFENKTSTFYFNKPIYRIIVPDVESIGIVGVGIYSLGFGHSVEYSFCMYGSYEGK
jgi:hypothetical protein